MSLYLAFVRMQWRLLAPLLVGIAVAVIAAFVLPAFFEGGRALLATDAQRFMTRAPLIGMVLGISAYMAGVVPALSWIEEGQANRGVYLMVLPYPRPLVALVEYAAGATFVVGLAAVVWGCAFASTVIAAPPAGLQAYPFDLGLRFFGTAVFAHALFFGASRTTASVSRDARLRATIALIVAGALLLLAGWLGFGRPILRAIEWCVLPGGPLHFLVGGWSLYDV